MTRNRSILMASAVATLALLSISRDARAGTWDNCNGGSSYTGTCFAGTMSSGSYGASFTTTAGVGVKALDTSSGTAVWGESSSGYSVYGESTGTGDAGHFSASNGNSAVAAVNSSTGNGVYASAAGGYGIYAYDSNGGHGVHGRCSGTNCYAGYFENNVYVGGNLTVNGTCTGCSDIRLKKDVEPLEGALDQLLKLKGVTYEWIDPSLHEHEAGHGAGKQAGFIAQDVEKVFPNWVKDDGYKAPDGTTYRTLELRQIEALEVESIRTLKQENDDLKARMKALETAGRPIISTNMNGLGFGLGGLALAVGAVVVMRRKREGEPARQE
jgi:hypothetical protein